MSGVKRIVISVVSHNQQELVNRLIKSFSDFVKYQNCEVGFHVIENTKRGYSLSIPEDMNVIYHENLNAKGFGANHNALFEKTKSDFFLVWNPDLIFVEAFDLEKFISKMETQGYALASPEILNIDQSLADYFRPPLSIKNIIKRKLFGYEVADKEWLAGMCLFIDSGVFRDVSGFDEKFFMYVEDCDLSKRIKEKKNKIGAFTEFRVLHDARRASRKNWRLFMSHLRSLVYFWYKNLMGGSFK